MNLREMAVALPVRGLRSKLLQQEIQIKQLEEENHWLRAQLAKTAEPEDKKNRDIFGIERRYKRGCHLK